MHTMLELEMMKFTFMSTIQINISMKKTVFNIK